MAGICNASIWWKLEITLTLNSGTELGRSPTAKKLCNKRSLSEWIPLGKGYYLTKLSLAMQGYKCMTNIRSLKFF